MKANTPVNVTTGGDTNNVNVNTQVNQSSKINIKSSITIGTVVVVAIVAALGIWLGGNGGSPAKAMVGDWADEGYSEIAISFYKNGAYREYGETGEFMVRSDKSLFMQYTGLSNAFVDDRAYTYEWNSTKGRDTWYITEDRLTIGNDVYVRIK